MPLAFENGYSPLLSLFTAALELGLAGWALTGPGRARILRPLAAVLLCLAGYQLVEVFVCADPARTAWARLGFLDVVWLPALSVWLLVQYAWPTSARARRAGLAGFAVALALCGVVVLDPAFVRGTVCSAVLATYDQGPSFQYLYGALYEVGLFVTVFGGISAIVRLDDPVDRAHTADLVAGTLAFMLPAFVTQLVLREVDPSMPSLMCHYALLLALFLARTIARERRR